LFVDLVLHQPQVSSCMESLETTASATDIPMELTSDEVSSCMESVEVSSSQVSSCVESLEATASTIDIPVQETNGHRQPVVILEALNMSQ